MSFASIIRDKEFQQTNMAQDEVVTNQKSILANQETILGNQKTIVDNQEIIKKNQASLDLILKNQEKILALLQK